MGTYSLLQRTFFGYLFVRLYQKKTIPEFIQENPRLLRINFVVNSNFRKVTGAVDHGSDFIEKLALRALAIAGVVLLIAIVLALLYFIGSAIFGSAPWWAVVIIFLLILILVKLSV